MDTGGRHNAEQKWGIEFTADNTSIIMLYLKSETDGYGHHIIFVDEQDRQNGRVAIPADLVQDIGNLQVWLIGENRYGRLKERQDIAVKR